MTQGENKGITRVPPRSASGPAPSRLTYLNDAWLLRLEATPARHTWTKPPAFGAPPCGRAGHAALAVGPHLVVFGGVNTKRFLNDLHVLHAPSRTWSTLTLEGQTLPTPRMRPALLEPVRAPDDDAFGREAPTFLLFGGTRAWGASAAVATATTRHDGDLFAVTLRPAKMTVSL